MKHFLLTIAFVLMTTLAIAGEVKLAWEPSPSQNVIGYAVCYGNELPADPTVCTDAGDSWEYVYDVGNVLETTIDGLAPGTWFFAVVATDGLSTSVTSNRVQGTVKVEVPTQRVHEIYSSPEAPAQINIMGPTVINVQ